MATTSAAMVTSTESVTIYGGTFTLNVTPGDASKRGLEIITNSASPSAFYDSAANQLPLDKNPDAERYTHIVLDWIYQWNKYSTSIMLLAGESRILTSLIAQSTAEFCGSDEQKILLTTFFFSQSDPTRNSIKHFVPTLAYGIIQSIPASLGPITQAVEKDPLILSSSIEKQFDKLILDPLDQLYVAHHHGRRAGNQDSTFPYLIVIHALDECQDASERAQILHLFERFYTSRLGSRNRTRQPWKILVTSKPDQTISEGFGTLPKSMASYMILLETDAKGSRAPLQSQAANSPTSRSQVLAPSIPLSVSSKTRVPPHGLRLLSIDGGGIRGISTLIILEEIMHRLKFSLKLQAPPKPCEVFDLAGGTGTGGLIVIMLFRLRMSVRDARDAYGRFMKFVFSERKRWFQGETFKASRLEQAVLTLISEQLDISGEKAKTEQMVGDETTPKCFVCATPTQDTSQPTLFRTWDGQRSHRNVTILEAARATCTIPTLFKKAEIADGEVIETFVDAGYRCNNPVTYVLREAKTLASTASCIVSLGTGLESIIEFPNPDAFQRLLPTQLIQVFKTIALDCEKTDEETAREFKGMPNFYFRLNVDRGMEDISLDEWEKVSEVVSHTKQYLLKSEVSEKVDKLVNALHPSTSS